MHTCRRACMQTCMHTCVHARMHAWMHGSIYMHAIREGEFPTPPFHSLYTYVYIYIHILMWKQGVPNIIKKTFAKSCKWGPTATYHRAVSHDSNFGFCFYAGVIQTQSLTAAKYGSHCQVQVNLIDWDPGAKSAIKMLTHASLPRSHLIVRSEHKQKSWILLWSWCRDMSVFVSGACPIGAAFSTTCIKPSWILGPDS